MALDYFIHKLRKLMFLAIIKSPEEFAISFFCIFYLRRSDIIIKKTRILQGNAA